MAMVYPFVKSNGEQEAPHEFADVEAHDLAFATTALPIVFPAETDMGLVKIEQLGQTAVMHYVNRTQHRADCNYVVRAMDNSRVCQITPTRYRVGAVVVTRDGTEFDGHTGETAPENHAEEEAIGKALAAGANLKGATIYSTIEPCTVRKSKEESCTDLIIRHGLDRVVFALREPDRFVRCEGVRRLTDAGVEVSELAAFAADVIRINSHIL